MWTQQFGNMFGAGRAETKHYKDQLSQWKEDSPLKTQDVPIIQGDFTEWKPQSMIDLLPFCIANDPNPPDFIGQMIDDGKCRQSVKMYPGSMDKEELGILKARKSAHYKKEAWQILFNLIPAVKPQLPMVEALSPIDCIEAINNSGDLNNSKVWVWMDYVRPGKNQYVVKTPSGFEADQTKPRYFAHKFLGTQRTEDTKACKFVFTLI